MDKKKKVTKFLEVILVIAVLCAAVYNLLCQTIEFFTISIAQVVSLIVAIVLAFWATQWKSDEQKIKEQMEKLIFSIQAVVSSPDFVIFTCDNTSEEIQKRITMTIRKLNNSIDILAQYSKKINIADDLEYIREQVLGYNNCVSEKVGDLDYLSKSEAHLRMYAENINSKCDHIILQLYTKL